MAWTSILHALWLFLPAYVANMSPVFTAKLLPRWNAPIDGGRTHKDGKRVLGDGKTWRGLVGGGLAGGVTAFLMALAVTNLDMGPFEGGGFGAQGPDWPLDTGLCEDAEAARRCGLGSPAPAVFAFGFIVGAMALVGDAVKSYFKRRRGKDRGAPWVPFDQLDFVVFGLAAMAAASPLLARGWVRDALLGDWVVLATLLLLTPLLHFLVNVMGYWLKLKEVPW